MLFAARMVVVVDVITVDDNKPEEIIDIMMR